MVNAHAGARGTDESLKNLQTNLSMTLATASFSDSDDMRAWKTDLLKETNTSFLSDSKTPFQNPVVHSVPRYSAASCGRASSTPSSLTTIGSSSSNRTRARATPNTDSLWVRGYDHIDLVFGEENGRDPLEGLFDALSHNPEAATHAFESKSDLYDMLGTTVYTDRESLSGAPWRVPSPESPPGTPPPWPLPHSAAQVKIMANIMHAVAQPDGGADLVTKGLGESFGDMAASYMPEISQAFAGADPGAVFLTNSDDPEGLDLPAVTRFLSATSADPAGRAGIIYGESIYTGNLLEEHLSIFLLPMAESPSTL